MSKDIPYECAKVNFQDLENYTYQNTDTSKHKITNWLSLSSQLQVDGLKSLHDALKNPDGQTVEQLREGYSRELLYDLEKLSKREELNDERSQRRGVPKFNKNFYNEIKQPPSEWSDEFKNFLGSYSQLSSDRHFIEKISAQMLLELGKQETTVLSLHGSLLEGLKEYKKDYSTQTEKDLESREVIMLKDQSGQTRSITFDELANAPEINLTGEQRDFIKSSWQQGSFANGWFTITHMPSEDDLTKAGFDAIAAVATNRASRDWCLIDMSEEGKVKVRSRPNIDLYKDDHLQETTSQAQAVLEVDITDLKGNDYTPGCASSKPTIQAYVSSFVPKIGNKIPPSLEVSESLEFDQIRQNMIKDCQQGYLHSILQSEKIETSFGLLKKQMGNEEAQEFVFDSIIHSDKNSDKKIEIWQNLVREIYTKKEIDFATESVKFYLKIEPDPQKQEAFAEKMLSEYFKTQTQRVDSEEKDKLKNAMVKILEPLCETEQEKTMLQNNAGKLVRECTSQAGKEMSWGQTLQRGVDKVKNFVKWVLGRENEVQKIIEKHPDIINSLKVKPEANAESFVQRENSRERSHGVTSREH